MLLVFLLLLSIAQSIDIVNHVTGGTGPRDSASRHNTLFIKVSSPQLPITEDFVAELNDAIVQDNCEPSFSGRVSHSLSWTMYCGWLGNGARMSAREKKPLPPLPKTMAFLASRQAVVDDYEYLGEYRRPAMWYGNYETLDKSMRLYFDMLDGTCGQECAFQRQQQWLKEQVKPRVFSNKGGKRPKQVFGQSVEYMATLAI